MYRCSRLKERRHACKWLIQAQPPEKPAMVEHANQPDELNKNRTYLTLTLTADRFYACALPVPQQQGFHVLRH